MDGMYSGAARTAASASNNVFGILYAEDFDNPSDPEHNASDEGTKSEAPLPAITQADVDAACVAAVQAARAEWQLGDERTRANAIASLGPLLAGIRDVTEQSTMAAAEATVTTILSIVTGLLPHFSRDHGAAEARALLGRLLPTIRSTTRIKVRVHPELVAVIERDLTDLEPDLAALIDVTAGPLERGDVKASWENGSATRDSRKITQAVQDALSELGLQQPVEVPSKLRMAYAD